jgi:hypothetical protein
MAHQSIVMDPLFYLAACAYMVAKLAYTSTYVPIDDLLFGRPDWSIFSPTGHWYIARGQRTHLVSTDSVVTMQVARNLIKSGTQGMYCHAFSTDRCQNGGTVDAKLSGHTVDCAEGFKLRPSVVGHLTNCLCASMRCVHLDPQTHYPARANFADTSTGATSAICIFLYIDLASSSFSRGWFFCIPPIYSVVSVYRHGRNYKLDL